MREEIIVAPNDTTRAVKHMIEDLLKWRASDRCNQQVVGAILLKLQEIELLSLVMVKHEDTFQTALINENDKPNTNN